MFGLLIALASLAVENRLQGLRVSVVAAHGLRCPTACAVFQDQRSKPSCGVLRKKLSLPFVQGINIYKMYFDLFPVTKKNRESFIVWNLGPRPIDKLRSINFAFAQPADGAIFLGN